MWVYIYTDNWIPNTIKSDLRWATLAWLQAQGWDNILYRFNSYTLNSNWLSPSTTSNNDVAFLYKNIPTLSSNSKIEMNVTWYLSYSFTSNSCSLGYTMTSLTTFPSAFSNSVRALYRTGTNSTPYEIAYNDSTSLCTQPTWTTAWNVTLNVKLNLSTWLIEYKLTWPETYTVSATLTSAQLENVLTYKNIWVIWQSLQQSQTCRIYTVELKVV